MSIGEFFNRVPLRDRLIGWCLLGGPLILLSVLGLLLLRPEPIERAVVLGCYAAAGAPSLEIKEDRIEISEANRRAFSYLVEPAKKGYRLSVRPALGLVPVGSRQYAFEQRPGIGYFWPLRTKLSDDPERLRHPGEFGGRFEVLAGDGEAVLYSRSHDRRACQ